MRKYFSKTIAALLAVLMSVGVVFLAAPVNAQASDSETYRLELRDEANLFSDYEEERLAEAAKAVLEYGNVVIITVPDGGNPYGSAAAYADQVYGALVGYQVTGILFSIDMDVRQIYLYSCGALRDEISVNDCNSITDNVFRYASEGDYYQCAAETLDQVNILLGTGYIKQPMMVALVILIALLLGFLIAYFIMKACMSLRKPTASELAGMSDVRFNMTEPIGTLTGSTRTYSPIRTSSGSGGGSSGGGGGGGGHGGGHSF